MRVWIDVDNPPQAQYLTPLEEAFRARGCDVLVTARDTEITRELLDQRGTDYRPVGQGFGRGRPRKLAAGMRRAASLRRVIRLAGGAQLLVSSSRPSALAARSMGIPIFVLCDYEHVELGSYRRVGAHLVFPEVIDRQAFLDKGFRSDRLLPYRGLKEDLEFASRTLNDAPPAAAWLAAPPGTTQILIRPPAEDSHYFAESSRTRFGDLLDRLAPNPLVRVILAPRAEYQVDRLDRWRWAQEPVVLREAVPAMTLYAAVDWVVCGGGTMLREAAYLGVPAVSILGSTLGSVDAYLASLGAVRLIQSSDELAEIDWATPPSSGSVVRNPHLRDELASELLEQITRTTGQGPS
jgi:uncharacterized protein